MGASKPGSPSYSYDADGRKISESLLLSYGNSVANSYAYTLEERLASAKIGSSTTTYSYDEAGNLTTATDSAGTATFVYNEANNNRLKTITRPGQSTVSVNFNALGQRTSQGTTTFTYTGTGRLATFNTPAGVDGTYTYDAAGQRRRSEIKDSANKTTVIIWNYDGLSLLSLSATKTGGEAWDITYLYDGAGRPYAGVYNESGVKTPFLIVTSDRGDVVALLTTAGTAFASYRYDAWGNPTASSNPRAVTGITEATAKAIASRQVLRYAGYVWDAESGTYYCSARQYDPATMQFLSKDPAKADGEESAYQYCVGDPVGNVDPSGEATGRVWFPDVRFTKDFTYNMKTWLRVNAGYAFVRRSLGRARCTWFVSMVYHAAAWDFKRSATKAQQKRYIRFDGGKISPEDFGNIHYGYVGAALNIRLSVLLGGSLAANGKGNLRQEFRDWRRISQGYKLYYRTGWGASIQPSWKTNLYVRRR